MMLPPAGLQRRGGEGVAASNIAALVSVGEPALALRRRAVRERLRVHPASRFLLDAVVAYCGRGVQAVGNVVGGEILDELRFHRVFRPHTGETVGLQFQSYRTT